MGFTFARSRRIQNSQGGIYSTDGKAEAQMNAGEFSGSLTAASS